MTQALHNHAAAAGAPGAAAWTPLRLLLAVLLLAAAGWLGWKAWEVNITLSCWKNEWPHLPVCDEINGRTPKEKVVRLQERLAANPGDSQALVALAVYSNQPGVAPQLDAAATLAAAAKAAPQNGDVLRLQAHHALQAQQWTQALDPLMRLSRYHVDSEATRALVELIDLATVTPELGTALLEAAQADTGWLERPLRAMPQAKVPMVTAMPLIVALVNADTLTPRLGVDLIRQLKSEGQWLEAHALWMQLWKRPLGFLFNGDFEQPFVAGGFDWETPGSNDHRSGTQATLVGRKGRGQVLRVSFNGKALNPPVVQQHLMLPPGNYRFSGEWQSADLRSEQGLTWVFSCAKKQRELARTAALKLPGRDWQPMQTRLRVDADCGLGVVLALQTQAPYEARTGLHGEVVFDGFKLDREAPSP